MSAIAKITSREILDSRGNPTVETKIFLDSGVVAKAAVPSGASTGTHEAMELRDGATKRYGGKGVLKAVKHVETVLAERMVGLDPTDQSGIDRRMIALDGTENKSNLGANAILSISLAVARAGAASRSLPLYAYIRETFSLPAKKWRLPVTMMNVLNGGRHADSGLSIQEFMIIPIHRRMAERVRMGAEIFHTLAGILQSKQYSTAVGDEGGFAPQLPSNEDAIKVLMLAIKKAGYIPGKQVFLGLDMAASEFYRGKKYYLAGPHQASSAQELIATVARWVEKYPFLLVEDPLAEDDWDHWHEITKKLGSKIRLIGDDLFVTNVKRIERGIAQGVANAVLIKPNQIGTLTETVAAITLAQKHKYAVAISHRSGETVDSFIADLAVATNAEFIKTGSLSRSERVEKYNRLMEIELELGM